MNNSNNFTISEDDFSSINLQKNDDSKDTILPKSDDEYSFNKEILPELKEDDFTSKNHNLKNSQDEFDIDLTCFDNTFLTYLDVKINKEFNIKIHCSPLLTNKIFFSVFTYNFYSIVGFSEDLNAKTNSSGLDIILIQRQKSYRNDILLPLNEENIRERIFAISIESFCSSYKSVKIIESEKGKMLLRNLEIMSPILLTKMLRDDKNIIKNNKNDNNKKFVRIIISSISFDISADSARNMLDIPIDIGSEIIVSTQFSPQAITTVKNVLTAAEINNHDDFSYCNLPTNIEVAAEVMSILQRLFYKNLQKFCRDYIIALISEDANQFDTLNSYETLKISNFKKIIDLAAQFYPDLI